MVILGQARLVVTFARVDDEQQVVDSQDVTYNLPRLDDASFADAKVMVGVHREALEQALCQQPVSIVDDLPEDEEPEAAETMPVTMFCPRPVETNSHTDA